MVVVDLKLELLFPEGSFLRKLKFQRLGRLQLLPTVKPKPLARGNLVLPLQLAAYFCNPQSCQVFLSKGWGAFSCKPRLHTVSSPLLLLLHLSRRVASL